MYTVVVTAIAASAANARPIVIATVVAAGWGEYIKQSQHPQHAFFSPITYLCYGARAKKRRRKTTSAYSGIVKHVMVALELVPVVWNGGRARGSVLAGHTALCGMRRG